MEANNKKIKLIAGGTALLIVIAITISALATANGNETEKNKISKTRPSATKQEQTVDAPSTSVAAPTTAPATTAPATTVAPVKASAPAKTAQKAPVAVATTTPTTLPKYVSFKSVTAKYVELPNDGLGANFKPSVTVEMSDDREVYVHVIFAFARTSYIGGATLETPVESVDKWVKISGTSTITVDWFTAPCDNMKYDVWIGEANGYNENSLIDNKVARTYDTRLMWAPGTEGTCQPAN